MKQKDPVITYMKAVGIILMVLCHARNVDFFYRFVYMFHMPLFFFVSGFCIKEKYFEEPLKFVTRRLKSLYIPYIKWGILILLLHNIFLKYNIITGEHFSIQNIMLHAKEIVINMSYMERLLSPTWFLPTLLLTALISFSVLYLLHYIERKTAIRKRLPLVICAIVMIISMCMYCSAPFRTFTFLRIGPRVYMAIAFFLIGYCFAVGQIEPFKWKSIISSWLITLMATPVFCIFMVDVYYDVYKIVPYVIVATVAIWSLYSLPWNRLNGHFLTFLTFVGNNTLPILILNYLVFKLVSLLIIFVYNLPIKQLTETPIIAYYANHGWWLLYTIVGVSVPLLIVYCKNAIISRYSKVL